MYDSLAAPKLPIVEYWGSDERVAKPTSFAEHIFNEMAKMPKSLEGVRSKWIGSTFAGKMMLIFPAGKIYAKGPVAALIEGEGSFAILCAICSAVGLLKFDRSKCVKCGTCMRACVFGAITMSPDIGLGTDCHPCILSCCPLGAAKRDASTAVA